MGLAILFAWSALSIIRMTLEVRDEPDTTMHRMRHPLAQLLEEVEQSPQEPSGVAKGARGEPLFAVLHQWQFWAFAGGLVVLFWLCWWLWKSSHEPGSSSKHGSSRSLEEEEEEEGEDPLHMDRFLDKHTLWPLPNRQRTCTVVEELVNDLLSVCRIFSGNDFMPRLQPAVGVGRFLEGWNVAEDFFYRLLVPLKPPPGHSFHLDLGTEQEMLVRNSCLRVELECTCTRQRRLGDMLCFLHHPEDKLMSCQEASLLQTLCTGSYLDVQKTALWLQELMTAAAAVVVPSSATGKLTVLPSTRFCKLKLTNAFKISLSIELILAVQQGNSNTFVTME
ncbi:inositol 1,4,5-trisphosphate receptor-interacting protein-like 1 [Balearica regulorum gibbericeps]|uniref:inositol 1,4,5-trisphosphate receptor-interacting protein-like 1 n=1 Tax=Balearica regulorum gibbericeps TaxID=100784 RepID=UPI003F636E3A